MYELACELVKQGHNVSVYSFDRQVDGCFSVHQVFPGRKFLGPFSTIYFSYRTLRKLLPIHDVDIIHGTLVPSSCVCFSILNRVFRSRFRLLLTSNGMSFRERQYCEINTLNDLALKYAAWPVHELLDALSTKGVCHIVAVTEENKKDLKQLWGIDEQRLSVIPPGIFVRKYSRLHDSGRATLTQNFFSGIFVGRLVSRKRVHLLLRLAKALNNLMKDFRILVVGDGYLRQRLAERTHALGLNKRVILLGNVPENSLIALLHSSDVFLFPSAYEGFGIVVLEAMASGLPVITSPIPVARFVQNGHAGYVVDWSKPEKTAEIVSELYFDPNLRKMLSDNALAVSKRFDWSQIASDYVKLYDMLCAQ